MSLTVVLIRHGKAEGKRPGGTDFERELAPVGRAALAEAYPRTLAPLLAGVVAPELWVSPAARAQQTAAEVAAALGLSMDDARDLDCLYAQDAEDFLAALVERAKGADGTVICVGHVPFMEELALYLGGFELPFSTGAAAAFRLDGAPVAAAYGRPPACLLWFVAGPRAK